MLDRQAELYCRDLLRDARATALRDAEGFTEILFAMERLGSLLTGKVATLRDYAEAIITLASRSPLGGALPEQRPDLHTPFTRLYGLVQRARNEALHQGAFARHLTNHCVELALVLEDALVNHSKAVGDYMVKSPLCAQLWQPLGFVRQQMLANSFSFLPVRTADGRWNLVSDFAVALVLHEGGSQSERTRRLAVSLDEAQGALGLQLRPAVTVDASNRCQGCAAANRRCSCACDERARRLDWACGAV